MTSALGRSRRPNSHRVGPDGRKGRPDLAPGSKMIRRFIFPLASAILLALGFANASQAASKLFATVSRNSIVLTNAAGREVSTLKRGTYVVVVRDRSPEQNFHLVNPPTLDKRTRLAFVGVVTWRVTFTASGAYRYFSDGRSSLSGNFRVR